VNELEKKIEEDLKIIALLHYKIGKTAMSKEKDFTEEYL
jgi:hypothetical protein